MKPQPGEEVLAQLRPEARILAVWIFSRALGALVVFGFLFLWFGMFVFTLIARSGFPVRFTNSIYIAFLTIPIVLLLAILYYAALRGTYLYTITNQRVLFEGGILLRVKRAVPYHKITDVEISQNIIEQLLGLHTLSVFTAGTVTGLNSPFGRNSAKIEFVGLVDAETPAQLIQQHLRPDVTRGE